MNKQQYDNAILTRQIKCPHCKGDGFFTGTERACPWCNPGGEWRASGYADFAGDYDPIEGFWDYIKDKKEG